MNSIPANLQPSAPSAHPLAGQTMTGADMIVQVLADEGVDTIFGYSGGAILPTYDAIFRYNERAARGGRGRRPMPLIVPANEQGAGFMAAGLRALERQGRRVRRDLGPGRDQLGDARPRLQADSVPMVVICGQVPRAAIGTDAFQEAPVFNIMGAVAKHCFLVTDPTQLEATLRTAFDIARTGRPGPVVIDIPKDVQNWQGDVPGQPACCRCAATTTAWSSCARARSSDGTLRSCSHMLARGRAPADLRRRRRHQRRGRGELCARSPSDFGIPVVTTLMGIGAVDTTHPLSMHMLGMHGTAFANYAVEDCDFLIAIGSRFDDRVAGMPKKFARNARRIAHLDVDASEIGKVKRVDWSHVGLLGAGAAHAARPWPASRVQARLRAVARAPRGAASAARDELRPRQRADPAVLRARADQPDHARRGVIATGVGQHQMWAAQYLDFREPRMWLTSGSMGTMGFGLPAAIGAQFARRDKLVIDVDGDASIRMNLGELETLTTYDLPVKVLLLNNFGDGMVRQWQKLFFKSRLSASDKSLHKKDFVKAAQADGFRYAARLDRRRTCRASSRSSSDFDGPAFLEVMIDPDAGVYPMVGPGMGYEDMITGDYIESRHAPKPRTSPARRKCSRNWDAHLLRGEAPVCRTARTQVSVPEFRPPRASGPGSASSRSAARRARSRSCIARSSIADSGSTSARSPARSTSACCCPAPRRCSSRSTSAGRCTACAAASSPGSVSSCRRSCCCSRCRRLRLVRHGCRGSTACCSGSRPP